MNNENKSIEIPFGAKDSELGGWEYTIPEGFEAVIENGKVKVRKTESEDEKIRKALMQNLKERFGTKGNMGKGLDMPDVLAWLEKQYTDPNKEYWRGYREGKQEVLDKYADLEKQGEQKPADKVEPKFKPDDWVVNKFGDVWHIDSFDKKNYQVSNGNEYNYFPISKQDEMHLWTIQDAKDGDVLTYRNEQWIFIFKSMTDDNTFKYHALISEKGFAINDSAYTVLPSCIVPATKEQRDILFQKMNEAGYEWDAEKKELKKVKKAPQKFMVGDTIKYNGTEYKITEITPNGYKVYALTYDEDAASLISFSAPAILVEQKSAWSEEDEEIYRKCICVMRASACGFPEEEKFVEQVDNWLKSLKDRVLPQPKTEWSEEDEEIIEALILLCDEAQDNIPQLSALKNWLMSFKDRCLPQSKQEWSEEDDSHLLRIIWFLRQNYKRGTQYEGEICGHINWLESLKNRVQPQSRQEWSEDNIKKFKTELQSLMFEWSNKKDNMGVCIDRHIDKLLSILWNHTQNTWKPSDKQLDALHDAAVYVDKSMFPYPKGILMKLYEQLKKLKG